MSEKLQKLLPSIPAIWDGGMGSLLLAEGLKPGMAPESWNIDKAEVIEKINKAYFDAGADIIQTNTFGGNRIRLRETGCEYSVEQVNRAGVEIALRVRPKGKLVAGDMGPSGLSFPPLGNAQENEIAKIFAEQAKALASAGVDLLLLETFSDLREAMAALKGTLSVSDLPVIVSMTFRQTKRGFYTIMGDKAVKALGALIEEGAAAVGANCTLSSKEMMLLAEQLRRDLKGILLIQPNAGEPQVSKIDGQHCIEYPEDPSVFLDGIGGAFQIGVDIIGGCCGTTPEHIKLLARKRDSL